MILFAPRNKFRCSNSTLSRDGSSSRDGFQWLSFSLSMHQWSSSPLSSPTSTFTSFYPSRESSPFVGEAAVPPLHPFAALSKSTRAPPRYEKKLATPPPTPRIIQSPCDGSHFASSRATSETSVQAEDIMDADIESATPSKSDMSALAAKIEADIWENALETAIDNAQDIIDLRCVGLRSLQNAHSPRVIRN